MPKQRYNAKIQRAKGLLEIAAAMYETSLSFQTTRAAEKVLQTESRVGHELELKLMSANRDGSIEQASARRMHSARSTRVTDGAAKTAAKSARLYGSA